jgi:hypothetical protein
MNGGLHGNDQEHEKKLKKEYDKLAKKQSLNENLSVGFE